MSHKDRLSYSDEGRKDLLKQISALMDDVTNEQLRRSEFEVDQQPIAVYKLPTDNLRAIGSKDLLDVVENTNRWHHQIKFNGKSLACARSGPLEGTPARAVLSKLWVSPLAEHVEKALDRVERDERIRAAAGNPLVRLLVVPAYQVNALWLINEPAHTSQVLVLDYPRFTKLESNQLRTSQQFIEWLQTRSKVAGMKFSK